MCRPSLFTTLPASRDKEILPEGKPSIEDPHPCACYVALDRLLEAIEDLLRGDCPLCDELRRRLSNPDLQAHIFDAMNKSLKSE